MKRRRGRKGWGGAGEEREFNFSIGLSRTHSGPPGSTHLKEYVQRPKKRQMSPFHTSAHLFVFPIKILNIIERFKSCGKAKGFLRKITKALKRIVYLFIQSPVPEELK